MDEHEWLAGRFTIAAGKIVAIDLLTDPDRLRQLDLVMLAD